MRAKQDVEAAQGLARARSHCYFQAEGHGEEAV